MNAVVICDIYEEKVSIMNLNTADEITGQKKYNRAHILIVNNENKHFTFLCFVFSILIVLVLMVYGNVTIKICIAEAKQTTNRICVVDDVYVAMNY